MEAKKMYMHTYGNADDPAVILLHPMGITADKFPRSV